MADNNENKPPMNPKTIGSYWLMGAIGAVALVGAIFAGVIAADLTTGDSGDDEDDIPHAELGGDDAPAWRAPQIEPAWPKPDVVLTDTDGNDYDLREETEGYVTVLALGFTNCPDECPAHMNTISRAIEEMNPDDADDVKVVFVTTDPERDTPEVLRNWLDLFDEDFVGLTGSLEEVEAVQQELGVPVAEQVEDSPRDAGDYDVSHSVIVYAFDKDTNESHIVFPLGVQRDAWVHDLTKLVREGWSAE